MGESWAQRLPQLEQMELLQVNIQVLAERAASFLHQTLLGQVVSQRRLGGAEHAGKPVVVSAWTVLDYLPLPRRAGKCALFVPGPVNSSARLTSPNCSHPSLSPLANIK